MTKTEFDGWRDFDTIVSIKTMPYVRNGETIDYVEYEVEGSVFGYDSIEIEDMGVWLDGWDVTDHLKESVIEDIEDKVAEYAREEGI